MILNKVKNGVGISHYVNSKPRRLLLLIIILTSFSCSQETNEDFEKGLKKFNLKDYRGAIIDFDKVLKSDSNYIDAYIYRGKSHDALNNKRLALQDFNKIILELNPVYSLAYLARGLTMSDINEPYNAIADFEKAIELNPNFGEAYFYLGLEKISTGQLDNGCLDLSKAGELGYEFAYGAIERICNH